jgi:hypothetical protein
MGLGVSQSSFLARLRTTLLRMPSSTPTLFPAPCIWWVAALEEKVRGMVIETIGVSALKLPDSDLVNQPVLLDVLDEIFRLVRTHQAEQLGGGVHLDRAAPRLELASQIAWSSGEGRAWDSPFEHRRRCKAGS